MIMSRMSSIAELKAIIAQRSKKPDNDRAPYIMKSQLVLEDSEEDMMFYIILSSDYLVRRYLKGQHHWHFFPVGLMLSNMRYGLRRRMPGRLRR